MGKEARRRKQSKKKRVKIHLLPISAEISPWLQHAHHIHRYVRIHYICLYSRCMVHVWEEWCVSSSPFSSREGVHRVSMIPFLIFPSLLHVVFSHTYNMHSIYSSCAHQMAQAFHPVPMFHMRIPCPAYLYLIHVPPLLPSLVPSFLSRLFDPKCSPLFLPVEKTKKSQLKMMLPSWTRVWHRVHIHA